MFQSPNSIFRSKSSVTTIVVAILRQPVPFSTTPPASTLLPRRALRRAELRRIVPLSNTTIYELEQGEDFPRRFYLTPRCVVWDSDDVYAWLNARKQLDQQTKIGRAPVPNKNSRRRRPLIFVVEDQRERASGGMK
jgi:prophage regulatory protein